MSIALHRTGTFLRATLRIAEFSSAAKGIECYRPHVKMYGYACVVLQ